jgi:hypothetical protein
VLLLEVWELTLGRRWLRSTVVCNEVLVGSFNVTLVLVVIEVRRSSADPCAAGLLVPPALPHPPSRKGSMRAAVPRSRAAL